MNIKNVRPVRECVVEPTAFGDELAGIIDTVTDLIDWLQDQIGNVKELIKNKAEKFKKNIRKLKDINGPVVPVRHR